MQKKNSTNLLGKSLEIYGILSTIVQVHITSTILN